MESTKIEAFDLDDELLEDINAIDMHTEAIQENAEELDELEATIITKIDTLSSTLSIVNGNVSSLSDRLTPARAANLDLLSDSANGLAAIKTAVGYVNTNLGTLSNRLTDGRAANLDLLSNGTYGLNAIRSAINNVGSSVSVLKSITMTLQNIKYGNASNPSVNLTHEQYAKLYSININSGTFTTDGTNFYNMVPATVFVSQASNVGAIMLICTDGTTRIGEVRIILNESRNPVYARGAITVNSTNAQIRDISLTFYYFA